VGRWSAPAASRPAIALVVSSVWLRSRARRGRERTTSPSSSPTTCSPARAAAVSSVREEARPKIDTAALELEAAERQKVRSEISTMVSERPDEVAAMLRGWLSENKA
jgi:flagellar M-ring protein FliF